MLLRITRLLASIFVCKDTFFFDTDAEKDKARIIIVYRLDNYFTDFRKKLFISDNNSFCFIYGSSDKCVGEMQ